MKDSLDRYKHDELCWSARFPAYVHCEDGAPDPPDPRDYGLGVEEEATAPVNTLQPTMRRVSTT